MVAVLRCLGLGVGGWGLGLMLVVESVIDDHALLVALIGFLDHKELQI
jgi:hypothetical protein